MESGLLRAHCVTVSASCCVQSYDGSSDSASTLLLYLAHTTKCTPTVFSLDSLDTKKQALWDWGQLGAHQDHQCFQEAVPLNQVWLPGRLLPPPMPSLLLLLLLSITCLRFLHMCEEFQRFFPLQG